jgi:hypothetical protein
MPYPRYNFTHLGVGGGGDYAAKASGAMGQASQSYASMDQTKPQPDEGSWVGDAAFLYAMGKETGALDDVKKAGKTYIPRLSEFISGGVAPVDPTAFDAGKMNPGAAPGAEFSKASVPTTPVSTGAAQVGASPVKSVQGALTTGASGNAARGVAQQAAIDTAAQAGVEAGVAGAGEAAGAAITGGATGAAAGAGTGAALGAGTTAMVGGLSTAAGGMGAAAAGGGALAGATTTAAAAGTALAPGVGTAIGLGIGALISMFA